MGSQRNGRRSLMKKSVKISGISVGAFVLILLAGISLTAGWRPILGPRARALTNRTFLATPERMARGKYLVESVSGCMDCHSPHDWTEHEIGRAHV